MGQFIIIENTNLLSKYFHKCQATRGHSGHVWGIVEDGMEISKGCGVQQGISNVVWYPVSGHPTWGTQQCVILNLVHGTYGQTRHHHPTEEPGGQPTPQPFSAWSNQIPTPYRETLR